ncbi:MAG TPA: hypothetical protein VGK45_10115 [Thermoanaerobaculia bacterium]
MAILMDPNPLSPLSQGQRSIWFVHHFAPAGGAYNIAAAAWVTSPIEAGALESAVPSRTGRWRICRSRHTKVDSPTQRSKDAKSMVRNRQAGLMRLTTGNEQITIPNETRERAGPLLNTEAHLEPAGQSLLERMRGKATSGMSTEDIMDLTRGEN